MTFLQGLINARSHIIFILGLLAAFGLVFMLETTPFELTSPNQNEITQSTNIPDVLHGDLTRHLS